MNTDIKLELAKTALLKCNNISSKLICIEGW